MPVVREAALVAAVTRRLEDLLGLGSRRDDALAGLSSQALAGQACLFGASGLDHPDHDRDEVAGSLVDLERAAILARRRP